MAWEANEERCRGGGRLPYHPAGLVGLILFGIMEGKGVLRQLETALEEGVEDVLSPEGESSAAGWKKKSVQRLPKPSLCIRSGRIAIAVRQGRNGIRCRKAARRVNGIRATEGPPVSGAL